MYGLERDNLAWCEIDGQLIFLDIAQDRYFRLPDKHSREVIEALGPPWQSRQSRWRQPHRLPVPSGWKDPARTSPAISDGPFNLAEVARALWVQRRAERRLAQHSFASNILALRSMLDARPGTACQAGCADVPTIRAFEHARLLRSAADRCLPRSIALACCLAARGVRPVVVIGVKLAPFGAHCWVQAGDEVLGDTAEEVLRYRPILVI